MRTLIAVVVLLLTSRLAQAREQESRLALLGTAEAHGVGVDGASQTGLLGGGGLRYGFGLTNDLELGGVLLFGAGAPVDIDGVADASDRVGTLNASPMALSLAVDLRLSAGRSLSRAFVRTHPLVGLRLGLAGRYLSNQQLRIDGKGVSYPTTDLSVLPFVGADLGVEHRFAHHFVAGLVAGFTYGGERYAGAQLALELSWHWY
jgi:hypothetical protein